MIKTIYCVHDVKSNVYGTPFVAINEATAVRSFARACNDPTTELAAFPADFNLYFIGSFDDESGKIEPAHPSLVATGFQLVKSNSEV